ncbi:MAG TPA: phage holin family protein [Myxococcota bacterium]|jgi:putative membrane protein
MTGFLIRWAVSALALWVAQALVPGIRIQGAATLWIAALLLGFVNAVVRPLLIVFTLPITILTLGLFLLVINAAMLGLVAAMLDRFAISGFWSALAGAVVVSLVSWLVSSTIGNSARVEMFVVRQRAASTSAASGPRTPL